VPAVVTLRGVRVQLVEIPGLIEGASEDRGGGRALLGVLRGADAIVFCLPANAPLDELALIRDEVAAAGIEKRAMLAVTKLDEAEPSRVEEIAQAVGLPAIGVSVLDDERLDAFRERLWELTGLMRVFLRGEPFALAPGATVLDAAHAVHHELSESCIGATISGPSAKFDGQRVGREHVLANDDEVDLLS
jgi:ribosome-interacting GTPase 1